MPFNFNKQSDLVKNKRNRKQIKNRAVLTVCNASDIE